MSDKARRYMIRAVHLDGASYEVTHRSRLTSLEDATIAAQLLIDLALLRPDQLHAVRVIYVDEVDGTLKAEWISRTIEIAGEEGRYYWERTIDQNAPAVEA